MPGDPCGERTGRLREWISPEKAADPDLLTDIAVGVGWRAGLGAIGTVGGEEGIGQRVVHPGIESRIGGVVAGAPMGPAADRLMAPAHRGHGRVDLGPGPECGRRDVGRGPGQAPERVFTVVRVLEDTGRHLGMGRLDQQGPDAADKHRGIPYHRPRR